MPRQLDIGQIMEAACKATGLDDFGGDGFREGLAILVEEINRDTARPDDALARNREEMVKVLSRRLQVTDAIARRPEVLDLPVPRPVFVMGIPRTGTTLLNNLLAADPNRRSLLTWELEHPVPPPTTATLYDDPRALEMMREAEERVAKNPGAGKYYRSSAIYPNEDVYVHSHDFKTAFWESHGTLPGYRDWFYDEADLVPTYAYHKRFLQLHQADAPGIWNLKMPSHALHIDALLKVFPDARLIWTHRDPFMATGSFCSLARLSQAIFTGRPDMEWIARNQPWQAAQHAERIMDARDRLGEDRVIDVHYADLVHDPLGAMRTLYAALGDPFTAEAEAGMAAWIGDNPQGKFGRHEYRLDEFGISEKSLATLFERYLDRYELQREVSA